MASSEYDHGKEILWLEHKWRNGENSLGALIKLYNPYHDRRGRFTSKRGAVVVSPNSMIFDMEAIKSAYKRLSKKAQKAVVAPAEYMSRKRGLGPKLARFGVELGSDMFISKLVGAAVFGKAALLSSTLAATVATGLFGVALPPAALVIGGVLVGAGANLIVSEFLDWGQTKVFNAYVNRYSPKDDNHIILSGSSAPKKAMKAGMYLNPFYWIGMTAAYAVPVLTMSSVGGLDLRQLAQAESLLEQPLFYYDRPMMKLKSTDEKTLDNTRLFTSALWPHVLWLHIDKDLEKMTLPFMPELERFPCFNHENNQLVMDKRGAIEFIERWAASDFPPMSRLRPIEIEYRQPGRVRQ